MLLVGAVRGDEAEDQHRVDKQVQKPMHARPAALHAAARTGGSWLSAEGGAVLAVLGAVICCGFQV